MIGTKSITVNEPDLSFAAIRGIKWSERLLQYSGYLGERPFIRLILENHLSSVIEFGCGDGNQLGYFDFQAYTGYDISPTAIAICNEKYKNDASKQFKLIKACNKQKADLTMSLDVIYHLIEDDKYFEHMEMLFSSSSQYVIIYAWNIDQNDENGNAPHVKHRKFTNWIEANAPDFELIKNISGSKILDKNGIELNPAEFYFFQKRSKLIIL